MGRLNDLEGLSHCVCGRPLQPDDGILCKLCEVVMADKPKQDDEVKSMEEAIASGAAQVEQAAQRINRVSPLAAKLHAPGVDWGFDTGMEGATQQVNEMDQKFNELENNMKSNLDVRVLKYDRDGRMTDVTDKVRPQDLRPENIKGFTADSNVVVPRNPDGSVNREGALKVLTGLFSNTGGRRRYTDAEKLAYASERAMREMEVVLDIADKTLEHWRK